MKRIRKQTEALIFETLDKTYFTKYSFNVKFYDEGETLFRIDFMPDDYYFFQLKMGKDRYDDSTFKITLTPGKHFSEETTISNRNFDDCIGYIETWVKRILEDVRGNNPIYNETMSQIDKMRRDFDKEIKKLKLKENEFFSAEEISGMQEKLEKLTEQFEELRVKNEMTEDELEKVKKELSDIKNDVAMFPKKVWYSTAGNKILNIFGGLAKSKTVQKALVDTATTILSDGNAT